MIIRVGDDDLDITAMVEQGYRLYRVNRRSITFWRPLSGEDFAKALEEETAEARRHPVVTICGSMRFYLRMLTVAEQLTTEGKIVIMPFVTETTSELKMMLDAMHFQKIDMAESVTVVTNQDRYIGDSTRAEIEYARLSGKPIDWVET